LFAGKGELLEACGESAAELGVADIVHFLGYPDARKFSLDTAVAKMADI
jgi:hypothetical protein